MTLQELFKTRESWTQGALARDKEGNETGVHSSLAVCWCLRGGIYKCYADYQPILKKINKVRFITHFNDMSTFEDVVKLIKELDI